MTTHNAARLPSIAPSASLGTTTARSRRPVSTLTETVMSWRRNAGTGVTVRRMSTEPRCGSTLGAMDGNRAALWVVADGRATRRQIQLGLRGLTQTEVTSGLRAGDWILADAQAAVAEGDRVRVVASGLPIDAGAAATRKELPAKLD